MATDRSKKEAGEMPCQNEDCESHDTGRNVIVFENSKGTLAYTCDKCGSSQYARVGEKVHEHWLRRLGGGQQKKEPAAPSPVARQSGGLIPGF